MNGAGAAASANLGASHPVPGCAYPGPMEQHAMRAAIDAADARAVRALLDQDPALAEADVELPDGSGNRVPALHYVGGSVFDGRIAEAEGPPLAQVLLDAGVDPNRAYAKSGDTYLIAAASLGAEGVGLLLLDAEADPEPRGLFGATALHWAAHQGLTRLVARLAERGDDILDLPDREYGATPLGWAVHSWSEGRARHRDRLPEVARTLLAAGARETEGARELARLEPGSGHRTRAPED